MASKEEILREYGLSDNEIKVYLASLMLGSCKVNEIAKKASLFRTTTYEILKELTTKGLVSYIIKSGIRYFEAAEPTKLIQILEEKKSRLKEVLPELQSIKKSVKEKPNIKIYEGKEGLKTILDDIINSKPRELLTLSSAKIFETLIFYFPKWVERRVKNKIYARVLQEKTPVLLEYAPRNREESREMKFLPKNFKINTMTQIYGNKTAILTLRKEDIIGVVIDDKDITNTQRIMFERLWALFK